MMWIVCIQDKETNGEIDLGFAIVEARTEDEAVRCADLQIANLARVGRHRCVARAKRLEVGCFYNVNALIITHGRKAD